MMSEILVKQTVSSTFWATIEKVGTIGIQFVVSLILARLLSPSDYGIIAMLMIFIELARQFMECGFGNALIRKESCSQTDLSTAFYFNIFVGGIFYIILYLSAPFISEFYKMPLLCSVLRIYGIALIFNSFMVVQNAILTRNFAFKEMAKYNILCSLVTGFLAICIAYMGYGVWALVFQVVSTSLLTLIFLSWITQWRPSYHFSMESMSYLWGFGSKMLLSGVISVLYGNIYSIVIGKFYDSKSLGVFNRGQQTSLLFPNIINSILGKSTLPILAKVQDEKERLQRVYRQLVIVSSMVNFPLVALIFVLAKPFIFFFLTDKWSESIVYIQIFAVSALMGAAGMINLNLLQAVGRSDLTLKADLIKKTIGFIVVALLLKFSPLVLAIGSTVMNIFIYCVNLYYAKKVTGLSFLLQIKDLAPYLFASVIMGILVYCMTLFIENSFLQLLVGGIIGVGLYFTFIKYIIKSPYLERVVMLIKNRSKL